MKTIISLFSSAILLASTPSFSQDEEAFNQLIEWMEGSFDSGDQAKADTNYFHITLKMKRIWPEATNGAWLYVEQAVASSPEKPYRQRVYFVSQQSDEDFSSDIYSLNDEAKFVGAWKDPSIFEVMKPADLVYKEGCSVFLFYDGFQYGGKTNTGSCESTLRGASYTTSEVTITQNTLNSWDRGYDDKANQVWGAKNGAYIFKKRM